ncbi:hypothetical protein ABB37_01942 [Leptomonas pyrrhocoris]|uniref:Uncharacterized protein n=1 Tax=Leptomonas pyrrhocoris TaxID=157538 RepID=A0A0M9G738_LEPPY|nr:hypothetical protein ABB37_01942 [Leptomonas pyrrhocoris]KPA83686.1 hypothetical protein ABB37_01942 [Leptomonas pyrrhocoris]|eukprot:XP_015662125.1 hypothetical protein ABB37_01942 [Leptomonas pyrrhocoris]
MIDYQRPQAQDRTGDHPLQVSALASCAFPHDAFIASTPANLPPASCTPQASASSTVYSHEIQPALPSFGSELNEGPVYPPVPTARHILMPSLAQQKPSQPSALSEPPSPQHSVNKNSLAAAAAALTVVKSPWEVLVDDTAANAAYAAKVQRARQLLHDFHVYQQQQQLRQDHGSCFGRSGCAVLDPSSIGSQQRGGSGSALGNSARRQSRFTGADTVRVLRGSQRTAPSEGSDTRDVSTATTVLSPALTHAEDSGLARSIKQPSPPEQCLAPFNTTSSPPLLLTPASSALESNTTTTTITRDNNVNSTGSFNAAALDVAKKRARRLLFYNAKARAAFSDQGLSLTRAVHKELLRGAPSTSASGLARQTGESDPTTPAPTCSVEMDGAVDSPGDARLSSSKPSVSTGEDKAAGHCSEAASLASAESEAEAKRALHLLCGIRAMRRQTEELTVALLHACGEWSCWDATVDAPHLHPSSSSEMKSTSPRQHLFADLFLRSGGGAATAAKRAAMADGEEGSATALYEEELRSGRAQACTALRAALHLPSEPPQDNNDRGPVNATDKARARTGELPRSAVAFLKLAEAPPPRAVPPPPPTSTQLALFASQQRILREAPPCWQACVSPTAARHAPSVSDSAPARNEKMESATPQPTQRDAGVHGADEARGVYARFQRHLHDLRAERRSVQRTYEALCTAAVSKAHGPRRRSSQTSSTSSSSRKRCASAKPRVDPADAQGALSREGDGPASPLRAGSSTLLSSPPVVAGEKTRPWMDSIDDGEGKREPLVTRDDRAAVESTTATLVAPDKEPAAQQRTKETLELPSSPRLASADGHDDPPHGNDGNAAPLSSKARARAAAVATAARLLSSSVSSNSEVLGKPTDRTAELHAACPPTIAPSSKESPPAGSPVTPPPVDEKADREAAPLPVSAAAHVSAERGGEVAPAAPLPAGSKEQRGPGSTQPSAAAVKQVCSTPEVIGAREGAIVAAERDGNTTEGQRRSPAAAASARRRRSLVESTLSEDDHSTDTATSTSDEKPVNNTGSRSESSYTASHDSDDDSYSYSYSDGGANVHATPHACAASWLPFMNATLFTHAGAVDAAAEAERKAREEGESRTHKASRSSRRQGVIHSPIGGLSMDVYDELTEWVSRQQQQQEGRSGTAQQSSAADDGTAAASVLSADDLRALSTWLRTAAAEEDNVGRRKHTGRGGAGAAVSAAAASTPPPPPRVQKALQIIFQGKTPAVSLFLSSKAATTATHDNAEEHAARKKDSMLSAAGASTRLPSTNLQQEIPAGPTAIAVARSTPSLSVASSANEEAGIHAATPETLPPVHPNMTNASTPEASKQKVVQSPRRRSLLKRLFSCGGR